MGGLRNILTETRLLLEEFDVDHMQRVQTFARANPQKYKELVEWAGTKASKQKQLHTYLEIYSSEKWPIVASDDKWAGDATFKTMPIDSLGALKETSGDLVLAETQIKSLGQLQEAGGNLDVSITPLEDLGQLRNVGEILDLNSTSLTSLNQLQTVGSHLHLPEMIQDLGQLRSVGGHLHLRGSKKIRSLGQLQTVGKDLRLQETLMFEDFGQLRSVGGDLYLQSSNFAKTHTDEQIRQQIEVKGRIYLEWVS